MKSNKPCLPGLTPVKNDGQAIAVMGGTVEFSGAEMPVIINLEIFGNFFLRINGSIRSKVAPSMPITNNLSRVIFIPDIIRIV
jgi:hypothetical protein